MKLIVGLGNPGVQYSHTRHNVGFEFLDFIVKKYNGKFIMHKFNAEVCELYINNEKFLFVKPHSFMNLSGEVVFKFIDFYKLSLDDLLVIQDDIDMHLGRVKIVKNSSSGGHNGIKNIQLLLKSKDFLRLKFGVSIENKNDVIDFVLGKFSSNELNVLYNSFDLTQNIVDDFGIVFYDKLMSKYNRK